MRYCPIKGEPVGPNGISERNYTAQHEAGHAVVSRFLCGFSVGGARLEILPDNVPGEAVTPNPACIGRRWAKVAGKSFHPHGPVIARIVTLCAGTEAERARYGDCTGDDDVDRANIERFLRHLGEAEGRRALLRIAAFLLVEYYEETINRVADVLAERHELTGEEIDELMPPDWIAQRGEPCDGDPLPCARCGPVRQACRPAGTWPLMLRQGA